MVERTSMSDLHSRYCEVSGRRNLIARARIGFSGQISQDRLLKLAEHEKRLSAEQHSLAVQILGNPFEGVQIPCKT